MGTDRDAVGSASRVSKATLTLGIRFSIAVASWIPAATGVLASLIFAFGAAAGREVRGLIECVPLLAWVALGVMTFRWLQDRRCHWIWPVAGTVVGIASAAMFAQLYIFYGSAVPLAIYLVYWHIGRRGAGEHGA